MIGLAAACISGDHIPAVLCLQRATVDGLLVTGCGSGSDKLRLHYWVASEQPTTGASDLDLGARFQYGADRPDVVGHVWFRLTTLALLLCSGQPPPPSNWKGCNSPYPGVQ